MTLRKPNKEPPFFSFLAGFANESNGCAVDGPEGDLAFRESVARKETSVCLGTDVSGSSLGEDMEVEVEYRGDVGKGEGRAPAETAVDIVLTESRLLDIAAELMR